jgi:hypothetical protein
MTKRVKRLSLGIGVALVLLVFAVPFTRDAVVGWARGEAFFRGRPTRYWEREVRNWKMSGDATPAAPTPWLNRLRGWLGPEEEDPAVLEAGQAAVPVLVELLRSEYAPVRVAAAKALGRQLDGTEPAARALLLAAGDESEDVRKAARLSLLELTYGPQAAESVWVWSDSQASLEYSIATHLKDYDVEVEEARSASKPFTIRIRTKDGGREVYTWEGTRETVLARWEHTLFLADPWPPGRSKLLAIDLRTGKLLWGTALWDRGLLPGSAYSHRLNLETDGKVVTLHGNETGNCYLLIVDCQTGWHVGLKRFR